MHVFTRYEPFRVYIKAYPITISLVLISVVLFIAMLIFGQDSLGEALYQFGAFYPDSIHEGDWYRFITAIFLHSSWMHLLMNMLFIYVFAPFLEHRFGKTKFLLFFILTGACSFVLPYFTNPHSLTTGASGAFYGLLALHLQLMCKEPYRYSQSDRQTVIGMLIVGFILSFLTPNTSIMGHIGGFIFGWFLSYLFFIKLKKSK
ncbi:hypothetical protein CN918_26040 [Priestia megaterium]|nr:hypothetical protein CN918_26040 [Priestia megaterium]